MKFVLPLSLAAGALVLCGPAYARSGQEPVMDGPEDHAPPTDPPGTLDTKDAMDHGVQGTVPGTSKATRSALPAPRPPVDDPATSVKLAARLDGNAETGKGDRDAIGVFAGRLNRAEGQLCYSMKVANLKAPTAAKIHTGPAGSSGDVALTLETPANGEATGCVDVAREVADAIVTAPENFYVNVQNKEFQNGAIRGQLSEG